MGEIVHIHTEDSELLGMGLIDLDNACANFMEMKDGHGDVLFHMVHSIMVYIEKYLVEELDVVKPTNKFLSGDDNAS